MFPMFSFVRRSSLLRLLLIAVSLVQLFVAWPPSKAPSSTNAIEFLSVHIIWLLDAYNRHELMLINGNVGFSIAIYLLINHVYETECKLERMEKTVQELHEAMNRISANES
jgi:hypothetical protein